MKLHRKAVQELGRTRGFRRVFTVLRVVMEVPYRDDLPALIQLYHNHIYAYANISPRLIQLISGIKKTETPAPLAVFLRFLRGSAAGASGFLSPKLPKMG